MSQREAALPPTALGRSRPALSSPALLAFLITGLWAIVFLLPQLPQAGAVLNLLLPDYDDAMRLVGVRDLLAGQSWFDTHQYRYLPPEGVVMHWSRLADAPLAAATFALTPILGQRAAEGWVALAWPPLLLLAYLAIVVAAIRRIAPAYVAILAALVGCQMVAFEYVFRLGHIDHHALQVVLVTAAALLFAFFEDAPRAPVLSGLLCGLSLAVGLEALPFVATIGAATVVAWAFCGSHVRASMVRFAVALAVSSLVAFMIQTAPSLWAAPTCDTLSTPWLMLTAGGAIIVIGLALADRMLSTQLHRLAAAAVGGFALLAVFVIAFPQCLGGPYEIVPEPYRAIWLADVVEAQPGLTRLASGSDAVFRAFGPLVIAALAAGVLALRTTGATRRMTALFAACLGFGVVLSLVQVRGLYIASAFVPPVAAVAVWRIIEAVRARHMTKFRAAAAVLAAITFLGLPWSVPAFAVRQMAPAIGSAERPTSDCLLKENLSALNRLPKGVVLGPMDLGAYTLLYTHHAIVAAGFHRGVEGIVAGIDAFDGSEADMLRTLRRLAPDYVAVCTEWAEAEAGNPQPFSKTLAEGASVPWLQPIPVGAGSLMVWRVRPEAFPPS